LYFHFFSFGDVSTEAILFDAPKMAGGYSLMFFYTMIMLGRPSLVEHREGGESGQICFLFLAIN
jgi:hypothetical protein